MVKALIAVTLSIVFIVALWDCPTEPFVNQTGIEVPTSHE
jgi:hypothetical protein